MTTVRQSATLMKRIANLIFISSFLGTFILLKVFETELSANKNNTKVFLLLMAPFFIGFVTRLLVLRFIKCSACGEELASMIMNSGNPFSVSKKIKFCPCCGASIDVEVTKPHLLTRS